MSTLSYESGAERFGDFLSTFCVPDENGEKKFVYADQIRALSQRQQVPLYIQLEDVENFDNELYQEIRRNTHRYSKIAYDVVDKLIKEQLGTEPVSFSYIILLVYGIF